MFLRILVPLDGSPLSERALGPAALLARQTLASQSALEPLVTLFRAVDLSSWLEMDEFEEKRAQAMGIASRHLEA